MQIEIEARLPSWNMIYAGIHHTKRTALKRQWHLLVREQVDPEFELYTKPVHITIWAEYKGVPCDPDNLCAKLVIDGLKGWVIADDNPGCVWGVTLHSRRSTRDFITVTVE